MTKKKATALAKGQEQMPAWLAGMSGDTRGSENVEIDDLVIPRLELVQSLSKVRKKTDPGYIEGIEEGMFYNNITKVSYGNEVMVIPVYFQKEWLLWRDQQLGGGFAGAWPSLPDAEAQRMQQEDPDEWESTETHQHFCLVIHDDGSTSEVVLSMAKSKIKKSKQWNSLIRINGGPRFSRFYTIEGVADQNAKGQDFYNIGIKPGGFVSEEQFAQAGATYDSIMSGKARADYSEEGAVHEDDPDF